MNNLLSEITQLTNTIETKYPELYRTLDENPMTIPLANHSIIDKEIMEDYLEGLKQILEKYLETKKRT